MHMMTDFAVHLASLPCCESMRNEKAKEKRNNLPTSCLDSYPVAHHSTRRRLDRNRFVVFMQARRHGHVKFASKHCPPSAQPPHYFPGRSAPRSCKETRKTRKQGRKEKKESYLWKAGRVAGASMLLVMTVHVRSRQIHAIACFVQEIIGGSP